MAGNLINYDEFLRNSRPVSIDSFIERALTVNGAFVVGISGVAREATVIEQLKIPLFIEDPGSVCGKKGFNKHAQTGICLWRFAYAYIAASRAKCNMIAYLNTTGITNQAIRDTLCDLEVTKVSSCYLASMFGLKIIDDQMADIGSEASYDAEVTICTMSDFEKSKAKELIDAPVAYPGTQRTDELHTLVFAAKISHWQNGHHMSVHAKDAGYVWNVIKKREKLLHLETEDAAGPIIHSIVHPWSTIQVYSILLDAWKELHPNQTDITPKSTGDPHMNTLWHPHGEGKMKFTLGDDIKLRLNNPGEGTKRYVYCAMMAQEMDNMQMLAFFPNLNAFADLVEIGKKYMQDPWRYGKSAPYAFNSGIAPPQFSQNEIFENVIYYGKKMLRNRGIARAPVFQKEDCNPDPFWRSLIDQERAAQGRMSMSLLTKHIMKTREASAIRDPSNVQIALAKLNVLGFQSKFEDYLSFKRMVEDETTHDGDNDDDDGAGSNLPPKPPSLPPPPLPSAGQGGGHFQTAKPGVQTTMKTKPTKTSHPERKRSHVGEEPRTPEKRKSKLSSKKTTRSRDTTPSKSDDDPEGSSSLPGTVTTTRGTTPSPSQSELTHGTKKT